MFAIICVLVMMLPRIATLLFHEDPKLIIARGVRFGTFVITAIVVIAFVLKARGGVEQGAHGRWPVFGTAAIVKVASAVRKELYGNARNQGTFVVVDKVWESRRRQG